MKWMCLAALYTLLQSAAAWGYVDPIYADSFDPFTCSASDNPQPNTDIAAEPGSGSCAPGMVVVGSFCIDRYEAALIDDTPGNSSAPWSPYFNPGTTSVHAVSAQYAVPQGYISQVQASSACAAAGKRLCSDSEWLRACQGPTGTTYPYGNTRAPGVCNDYRVANPVLEYFGVATTFSAEQTNHPCINQQPQTLERAGSKSGCVSVEGVFDLMGNSHEWTADPSGTLRGGDYVDTTLNGNGCLYATTAHDVNYHDYSTGFRCCTDAPASVPTQPGPQ